MEEKVEKQKVDYNEQTRIFKILKALIPYVVIVIVVVLIRTFIMTPVKVTGSSMYATLKDGDVLILNKLNHSYKRFDIVVANVENTKIIKRVIGLPGETIEYKDCKLYINGKEIEDLVKTCITEDFSLENLYNYTMIPEGYYFVMGDNRKNSLDSRSDEIGLIPKDKIDGTVSLRLYPFYAIGTVK